ncbi:hypothetical protein DUNSADRAFT_10093 [Dunaliella salina]|uniref:Encoded protein n=1 Tax=Dunaliella salina TaxID=3046 RepID=A0ABQ7GG36_DUNSA|nr:hypothetical protein DUNSADRAFT_10093 [Dunaliella salina]|eukprot:KAF5833561.1 hypothetical protein DUNSADRAFT_10093 [Dunaliella salina]
MELASCVSSALHGSSMEPLLGSASTPSPPQEPAGPPPPLKAQESVRTGPGFVDERGGNGMHDASFAGTAMGPLFAKVFAPLMDKGPTVSEA